MRRNRAGRLARRAIVAGFSCWGVFLLATGVLRPWPIWPVDLAYFVLIGFLLGMIARYTIDRADIEAAWRDSSRKVRIVYTPIYVGIVIFISLVLALAAMRVLGMKFIDVDAHVLWLIRSDIPAQIRFCYLVGIPLLVLLLFVTGPIYYYIWAFCIQALPLLPLVRRAYRKSATYADFAVLLQRTDDFLTQSIHWLVIPTFKAWAVETRAAMRAWSLLVEAESYGDGTRMDRAVEEIRAVTMLGSHRLRGRVSRFTTSLLYGSLAEALHAHWCWTGRRASLDEAIEARRLFSENAIPDVGERLENRIALGELLVERANLTRSPEDLRAARTTLRRALRWCVPFSERTVRAREVLARVELIQFRRYRDSDHERAWRAAAAAARLVRHRVPSASQRVTGILIALEHGSWRDDTMMSSGAVADLREFLGSPDTDLREVFSELEEIASILWKIDSPETSNLAILLMRQMCQIGTEQASALTSRKLNRSPYAAFLDEDEPKAIPPHRYVTIAYQWGKWAIEANNQQEAAEALETAITLLPTVALHGYPRDVQRSLLASWSHLAIDAAALHLALGRPERAVELLDRGRALLWSQLIRVRSSPVELLRQSDPEAARELDEAMRQLRATRRSAHLTNEERLGAFHRTIVRITERYSLHALPTYSHLQKAAAGGCIVVLNCSQHRTDAIIVPPTGSPIHVPLPDLWESTWAAVHRARALDLEVSHAQATLLTEMNGEDDEKSAAASRSLATARADRRLHRVAVRGRLWEQIADPLLRAGVGRQLIEHGARIWWCPTGPLTFLPIHAAGLPGQLDSSLLSLVVSSYTTTLAQLTATRSTSSTAQARPLVISPATDLDHAAREVGLIRSLQASPTVLIGHAANTAAVAARLPFHRWVHFVGHGQPSGLADGSEGGLVLSDAVMSATDLSELPFNGGELAYLSICDGATPEASLVDEALHPAAVLQFAGYAHVIATLDPIADDYAPDIAQGVYDRLHHGGILDASSAGRALHDTVIALRSAGARDQDLAPYVHFGP